MRILVTGSNGQVGQELQAIASDFPYLMLDFTDRQQLDISDSERVAKTLRVQSYDYLINCAAYTAVDRAEMEPEQARRINTEATGILAEACRRRKTFLVHLSTDYVYHNEQNVPLTEDSPTHPQGIYAQTKLAGEHLARQQSPESMIIRTSWVYSAFGHNFLKTMLRLGLERPELRVVYDQIGTPTYARDLARAILQILQQDRRQDMRGIFNFSNEGVTSWYDFAHAIFAERQIHCQLQPIRSAEYPTAAPRPAYSVLDKQAIRDTFQLLIPHWREGLLDCLQRLN